MEASPELIARAREDAEAFGDLYDMYVGRIYNYIIHRTGSAEDAEDLTSRTFHQALAHIRRYKDQGLPLSAWLYRIAHNLVANWHRDQGRRKDVPLDELILASRGRSNPDQVSEAEEEAELLRQMISRLNEDRQELLALKFLDGLSNAEIAHIMGRSEGAIKSLYHRTLVELRGALQAQGLSG